MDIKLGINITIMKGDWGNILYIVLMIVFVIFGALKKKKPVNIPQADDDLQPEGKLSTSVEHIFDSLLGGNVFEAEQEHPYGVMQDEIVEDKIEEIPIDKIKREPIKYRSPAIKEVEDDEFEDDDEIDWKQAIIYREILDRKYI
ncbi:hypothetical protein [Ancylomarina sp. 16SWW S1-10-2]|uniref:hypothetical protein n=1 Tax=Ancylomarina sp. 16SWW S1-10-2 TaxID=2499681 RepID=UPI0012AD96FD|nr:hypothetical protein [Ancylomarina sp. 16SWW S1-10-2]MRT91636.1 hypothetical protein [Ancylomarina sp. 16SWW S1-10-2]